MSPEPNNSNRKEEILQSLEGIQRAKAPAFFYTRLQATMEKESDNAGSGGFLGRLFTRPVLSLSIATLIILLNITTITRMWKQETGNTADYPSQPQVAADYTLNTYPVYDETPTEP